MRTAFVVFCTILIASLFASCSGKMSQVHESAALSKLEALREEMVALCEQHVTDLEARFETGVVGQNELDEARIKLLDARIDLAELKAGINTSVNSETSAPNDAIIAILEEAVAVRQRDAELARIRLEEGRLSTKEVAIAETRLSESRVTLADAKGDGDSVIAELETLIETWQHVVDLAELHQAAGRGDDLLTGARLALLRTQIDLIVAQEQHE